MSRPLSPSAASPNAGAVGVAQVLGVQPEDLGAARRVGRRKVDAALEAREQRGVEVLPPVGRADERDRRRRLQPVHPPEEHREHPAARLVHLALAVARERVELVEEEEGGPPSPPSASAASKIAASCCSPWPSHLEKSASSGAYTIGSPASAAAMRAAVVFPVPGGP